MTHTVVDRQVENFGSFMAEVLEIDISALDSAGTETGVSPSHIDDVYGFVAHVSGGTGQVISWDETNNELEVTDGSGTEVANDATVNGVRVTWIGDR